MRATQVEVARLRVHPRNIRTRLTGIERLARSIQQNGVQVPLLVHRKYVREPGKQDLEVIFGHRRLAASIAAGLSRVPALVRPFTEDREILLLMLAERERVPNDPAGVASGVRALRDEFGMDNVAIATQLGTSVAQVRSWLNGMGDIVDAEPDDAPGGVPLPEHPTAGTLLVPRGDGVMQRRIPSPRRTAPPAPASVARPVRPSGPRTPQVPMTRLHHLVTEHDAGRLDPATVVDRLRGLLGGWTPPTPAPRRTGSRT
jgi:ParB/RepB/Spo0J family partition protein